MGEDFTASVDARTHGFVTMDYGSFDADILLDSEVDPDNRDVDMYPRGFIAGADGNIQIVSPGRPSNSVIFPVKQGVVYPCHIKQITDAGTTLTASQIIVGR